MRRCFLRICALLASFFVSTQGFSTAKTLIMMEGGKAKPGLAKSWKKLKEGEYEFLLDISAEVKSGTKITPLLVKDSLEAKLGGAYGVKVLPKGSDKISISFKGDEQKFLDQVSKTKIRGGKDVELALEGSVSEGSIRAKKAERSPSQGEVKGLVLKIENDLIFGVVNTSNSDKIPNGKKIKVKGKLDNVQKNEAFFFTPDVQEGDVWIPKSGSLLRQ